MRIALLFVLLLCGCATSMTNEQIRAAAAKCIAAGMTPIEYRDDLTTMRIVRVVCEP